MSSSVGLQAAKQLRGRCARWKEFALVEGAKRLQRVVDLSLHRFPKLCVLLLIEKGQHDMRLISCGCHQRYRHSKPDPGRPLKSEEAPTNEPDQERENGNKSQLASFVQRQPLNLSAQHER